ncbi:ribose-phosphate pyrophosphokinase [Pleurocapsa sp. PCC 7327]|uniref:ribose-phosphate diphosphokinase n=1 Tax=Pleurocapsa sp. PCC 7327 TaxID=118163 RepID=UPI00029F8A2A|nr:ribose-phosphate diphosphokinase [Pleurocapsa sp. PCC 7327]AFY76989.1 ribose-phosphate pyrophosphokinase [Pleurocapsa sp. PCC 7327]
MIADFTLFSGTANRDLAIAIARQLGVPLGNCTIRRFPDSEVSVQLDRSVRGQEVFIVQPTSPPVDENLLELLAFADACRRAAADRITAIVPYFGYARSDKRHGERQAIMASLVAELMQTAGIDRLITVDLHAAQIEGFFRIPVDSLSATPTLYQALRDRTPSETVVVSPDSGRIPMAIEFAQRLGTTVAVLHKQRQSDIETTVTHVVGDVRDKTCLIVDDMITTGGTIATSIEALLAAGAKPRISVAATHGLFVKDALTKLDREELHEIFVTDTVSVRQQDFPKLQVVSIAPCIAEAIQTMMGREANCDPN